MHNHQPNLPHHEPLTVEGLLAASERLNVILIEEREMMDTLRFHELSPLQEEKNRLSNQLELYQRHFAQDSSLVKAMEPAARESLQRVTDALAVNIEDNFRKVSTLKAVNQRIVQAILEVMGEQQRPATYGRLGRPASAEDMSLSVNLNQKA